MIEEPVPTMPLMVPASSPTTRMKRKPKSFLRDSFGQERKATNFRNAAATRLRPLWRDTSLVVGLLAADSMLAAGTGYEPHRVGSFGENRPCQSREAAIAAGRNSRSTSCLPT